MLKHICRHSDEDVARAGREAFDDYLPREAVLREMPAVARRLLLVHARAYLFKFL